MNFRFQFEDTSREPAKLRLPCNRCGAPDTVTIEPGVGITLHGCLKT